MTDNIPSIPFGQVIALKRSASPISVSDDSSAVVGAGYGPTASSLYLLILFLVSTSNYFDRNIVSVLLEEIKGEFLLSDKALGAFSGICFSLSYIIAGIPVARWADRGNRPRILALALSVWSVATAACGAAQSFGQLAAARVLVGVGESGAITPAQSLIADYFPRSKWAIAFATFEAAGTAGYLLGISLGGYLAATHGWRVAFILAGLPGLALTVLVATILPEPRNRARATRARAARPTESLAGSIGALRKNRSFLLCLAGNILQFIFSYGVLTFIPSFLMRVLHRSLTDLSVDYAAVTTAGSLVGIVAGGYLAQRLGRDDVRWYAWIPAIGLGVLVVALIPALLSDEFAWFLAAMFVAFVFLNGSLPAILTSLHIVCGGKRRAVATAIFYFSSTLLGSGGGSFATGFLSDMLTDRYGPAGLRYALILVSLVLIPSSIAFYRLGKVIRNNIES